MPNRTVPTLEELLTLNKGAANAAPNGSQSASGIPHCARARRLGSRNLQAIMHCHRALVSKPQ